MNNATKRTQSRKPTRELLDQVIPLHDKYWQTEEAMAEGNPVLALERGERVELPPVLYIQGTNDKAHPRVDLDRFVAQYRKAGGQVQVELFEGEAEGCAIRNPASLASARAVEKIIEFVHEQVR